MIDPKNYNHKLYEIAVEGKSGDWELKKEILESLEIVETYDYKTGKKGHDVLTKPFPCVKLTQIQKDNFRSVVMDNSPWHIDSYRLPADEAHGKVLSCGQGVGLFPFMIWDKLKSGEIIGLDVVELNQDVINLTQSVTDRIGFNLIKGDAWKYIQNPNNSKYDFIFWDVNIALMEVIAHGPIAKSKCVILNPGGVFRYWGQEIGERLSTDRNPSGVKYSWDDIYCWACGSFNPSKLYGGLCKECADEYESFLYGDSEPHANGRLSETLKSLGYGCFRESKLPGIDKPIDILVAGDGEYLVEGKKDLNSSTELDRLFGQIDQYRTLRDKYKGLKVVVYGDIKWDFFIKLREKIKLDDGWVEIYKGSLK